MNAFLWNVQKFCGFQFESFSWSCISSRSKVGAPLTISSSTSRLNWWISREAIRLSRLFFSGSCRQWNFFSTLILWPSTSSEPFPSWLRAWDWLCSSSTSFWRTSTWLSRICRRTVHRSDRKHWSVSPSVNVVWLTVSYVCEEDSETQLKAPGQAKSKITKWNFKKAEMKKKYVKKWCYDEEINWKKCC